MARRTWEVVVRLVVAVLTATLLGAPPAHAGTSQTIDWGPCSSARLRAAGAQCGYVTLPLDYSDPSGATIQLAVSRILHSSSDYQGVMLVNPGGPGASGLNTAAVGSQFPDHAGDSYDWIGFDPRGVGASKPALRCDPGYVTYDRPSYVPLTARDERTWLGKVHGYADACGKANLPLLQHMTTVDNARDMDGIRAALGASQLNYYGYSYGTYLGQVYATLFPRRVRRMVLDSTEDPRGVYYQDNLNQDVAFDRNLRIWFGWVAQYDSVYHLGTTERAVESVFVQQLAKTAKQPAGGVIGPDELIDVFEVAPTDQETWLTLGSALSKFVRDGDWQTVKSLFDSFDGVGDDNNYAVYLAVQCGDVRWPTNWNQWRADNWRTFPQAPYFTWQNAWFNAPCVYWPAKPATPVQVDGRGVGGVLMIDETLDAPTPFEGSLAVRKLFPGASLIAEPGGTSHAVTPLGDACVDDRISAYLATGALPPRRSGDVPDLACQPLPRPVPS